MVRRIEERDADALLALYAGLDDEARHRRFFSMYRPGRSFVEREVSVAGRGGAGVVALVAEEGAGDHIVAEASYEVLPNGNGELAITVERAWRGWLGPYLLDVLVGVASSQGVPDLEADVLLSNGPMLALVRSRGYVAIPSTDWTLVRVMIGAEAPTPTWPVDHDRLRVLVEGAGGHWHADAATAAGLHVLACPGPVARSSRCPVLAGEPCPLASRADAIVISHPPSTDTWSTVRAAHPRLHPGVPVCIELPPRAGGAARGEVAVPAGSGAEAVAVAQRLAQAHADDERAAPEA